MRKAAGYEISDRIEVAVGGDAATLERLEPHRAWLSGEVLATSLVLGDAGTLEGPDAREPMELEGSTVDLAVRRAPAASVG
jgi:isoleucyl-tRNA synthetase